MMMDKKTLYAGYTIAVLMFAYGIWETMQRVVPFAYGVIQNFSAMM